VRHTTRRFVSILALAGAAGALAAAQTTTPPQDQPQQPPKFRVESNFVRVDAYPLKDGKPLFGLRAEDFEVLEDGVPQKIETFEHVVVRSAGSQEERLDPGSQREMLQATANPRNRVFIIFLDTPHVTVEGAHGINEPLIRLIDRILGPDDLVGVMTPAMAASQIVLGRKTQVIEESLRRNWAWGDRFTLRKDERELAYMACYPTLANEKGDTSALAKELIQRKRERATLEALEDLVRYLRGVREERKAILTVTEGWLLYGEDKSLMKLREDPVTGNQEPIPTLEPVGVGPDGTLTTKDPRRLGIGALTKSECDGDRTMLAMMNNRQFFLDLMNEANFANASFYPIDPRGLPAFDNPLGPDAPPPINVDHAMLKNRIEVMRTLAANTDGIAVVNNNDLDRGMRRISDDLTSYYLLGYYSANTKLDGKYRALKVRVRQPGVEVRARKGYRAATEAEITTARRAADAPVPEITRATTAAIDQLGRIRPESRFRIHAVTGGTSTLWVAGELQGAAGKQDEFAQGATATIEAMAAGFPTTTSKVVLKAGERTFLTAMALPATVAGQLDVRARLKSESTTLPLSDAIRLDAAPSGQPLLFRRGITTGNRLLPAADFRFSRTERIRIEIPISSSTSVAKPGPGRVLDRAGQPLQVPVTIGERSDEAGGQRWITADVTLAPLSVGDYAIEVTVLGSPEQRTLVGIRVTR
jgi:VWFA-related protein